MMQSIGTPGMWFGFTALILVFLALDLGLFHRKAHAVGFKEALFWSVVWIGTALLFNAGVYAWFGAEKGLEFLTGYVIEKALSVDNIFVFMVIFTYFNVDPAVQHRVLFWGIVGALVLRALFILAGAAMLAAFHWVIYIFGVFLIYTGLKIMLQKDEQIDPGKNPVLRFFKKFIPVVPEYDGSRFFTLRNGKRFATPLLLVLIVVETTDVVFAVDSIPAIFAVTKDPFIVYTSNIFAILGLRALFFLIASVIRRFVYLKVGLSLVLVFVGIKMTISDFFHIPIGVSLAVVAALLSGSILYSFVKKPS